MLMYCSFCNACHVCHAFKLSIDLFLGLQQLNFLWPDRLLPVIHHRFNSLRYSIPLWKQLCLTLQSQRNCCKIYYTKLFFFSMMSQVVLDSARNSGAYFCSYGSLASRSPRLIVSRQLELTCARLPHDNNLV